MTCINRLSLGIKKINWLALISLKLLQDRLQKKQEYILQLKNDMIKLKIFHILKLR